MKKIIFSLVFSLLLITACNNPTDESTNENTDTNPVEEKIILSNDELLNLFYNTNADETLTDELEQSYTSNNFKYWKAYDSYKMFNETKYNELQHINPDTFSTYTKNRKNDNGEFDYIITSTFVEAGLDNNVGLIRSKFQVTEAERDFSISISTSEFTTEKIDIGSATSTNTIYVKTAIFNEETLYSSSYIPYCYYDYNYETDELNSSTDSTLNSNCEELEDKKEISHLITVFFEEIQNVYSPFKE